LPDERIEGWTASVRIRSGTALRVAGDLPPSQRA
jgi:hypothetical protein